MRWLLICVLSALCNYCVHMKYFVYTGLVHSGDGGGSMDRMQLTETLPGHSTMLGELNLLRLCASCWVAFNSKTKVRLTDSRLFAATMFRVKKLH